MKIYFTFLNVLLSYIENIYIFPLDRFLTIIYLHILDIKYTNYLPIKFHRCRMLNIKQTCSYSLYIVEFEYSKRSIAIAIASII